MTTNQPYLQQLHYQITPEDYAALRDCLSARTVGESARSVHTMFFNSYLDRMPAYSGQELSVPVARFSLNYYDGDPTYLILERRMGGQRTGAMVAEAECRGLLAGETDWLLNRHNPLLLDFYDGLTERMLLPQMIVSYQREIYTAEGLDLWVALDTGIRSSMDHMNFLDPRQLEQDTADQETRILMEVSYSSRIPDDVLCLLEKTAPRRKLVRSGYLTA